MARMEYNERKYCVLEAVFEFGEATAQDVYGYVIDQGDDIDLSAVQMALLRYHRQGLLTRRGKKTKIYELSEKGEDRLLWLEENQLV